MALRFDLTPPVRRVMQHATDAAVRLGHEALGNNHLLFGILHEEEGIAFALLQQLGCDASSLKRAVEKTLAETDKAASKGGRIRVAKEAERAMKDMDEEARQLQHEKVGTHHLLLALLRRKRFSLFKGPSGTAGVRRFFQEYGGITYERVRALVLEQDVS